MPTIEGEVFKKPILVGQVNPGEKVIIRLSARRMTPEIGDEEIVSFPSHWLFEDCSSDWQYNNNRCPMEQGEGTCQVKHRQYHGLDKEPLNFLERSEPPPIHLTIGENRYRLEKILHREEFFIVMEFNVAPAMIAKEESNRMILFPPVPDKNPPTVKSGTLGFHQCPDRNEYGFNCNGCQRQIEHLQEQIEYTLDVIVQQPS